MRILLALILVVVLAAAGVFYAAGRFEAPVIRINQPAKVVGVDANLDVTVEAAKGSLTQLDITLEQGGKSTPLFSLASPASATLTQETADRLRITRPIGKRALPDLQAGTGRLVVKAARKGLYGLRTRESSATRDFTARFTPPRISVVSMHHFINLGGSEFIVYRVSPPDVESGVQVGDTFYPGYPASGAGGPSDPSLKVAFFALLYDQDLNTPMSLVARDEAGNQARGSFDYKVFPKTFVRSRIELPDAFLQRVVPEILDHTPELKLAVSQPQDYLNAFLKINNDLRRIDAQKIIDLTTKPSAPSMLWKGPFVPLGNAAIESKFADHRSYFYQGKEVDQQVHLGFDLAVTVNIPVKAGNDGKVVYADYLGIYGNCVIIDHGMGVSSLYGHLASIDVKAGDTVTRGQVVGRSGMTGLAGGDHLHFSIQVQGRPVNPVEWWDPHWIDDRVLRKIREAGGQPPVAAAPEGQPETAAVGAQPPAAGKAAAKRPRRGRRR